MILITLLSSCSNSAPETHTVTFYSEEEVFLTEDVVHGQAVSRPEKTPSRPGSYRFMGWQTADGTDYNFSLPVTEDLSLYAGWEYYSTITYYTVTFDGNEPEGKEASELPDPITGIRAGVGIAEPDTEGMTLDGYIFDGWYKDKDCKEKFDFDSETISSSITLYAKWTELFTVTFDTGEGGSSVEAQEVRNGETATKPEPNPTRQGYEFDGWYAKSNGTDLDANQFDFSGTPITAKVTIYAKWNPLVTFDANGEDVTGMPSPIAAEDGKISKPKAEPSREGHTFQYWSTGKDGTEFSFDTPITTPTTLYAVWKIKQVTITFSFNGMDESISKNWDYGKPMEKEDFPPLPKGDIFTAIQNEGDFKGWGYENSDEVLKSIIPKEDVTLYPKWKQGYIVTDGYQVYSPEGLLAWANAAASDVSLNCDIFADITLPEGHSWPRIGYINLMNVNDKKVFTGTIDGNGHTVSGLVVDGNLSAGFVGCLGNGGIIKDLILKDAEIKAAGDYVVAGGFAAFSSDDASIKGCAIIDSTMTVKGKQLLYAGGITGYNKITCSIIACYAVNVEIEYYLGGSTTLSGQIGGIAGCSESGAGVNSSSIISCYTKKVGFSRKMDGEYRHTGTTHSIAVTNDGVITACVPELSDVDDAKSTMNTALQNSGHSYEYIENLDESTKNSIPLVLEYPN